MRVLSLLMMAAVCAGPVAAQDYDDNGNVAHVFDLINAEREDRGCAPLNFDPRLNRAAQRHADAMARQNFFAHKGPDGTSAGQRAVSSGYRWIMVAENIAAGHLRPEEVVDGWMNSPGHRANILSCTMTDTGIALSYQPDDRPLPGQRQAYRFYWVQVFAKPAK